MHARSIGPVFPVLVTLILPLVVAASIAPRPTEAPPRATDDALEHATAPALADAELSRLANVLDTRLAQPRDAAWLNAARMAVWTFVQGLQAGRLTPPQKAGVLRHLDAVTRTYPVLAGPAGQAGRIVRTQTVGTVAPEITGRDLDGVEFKLSDYRGKVVVLTFTGDWCGICRSEYPYERFLLDLYRNWPLAILGVNSDPDRKMARQAARSNGLTYRSWWDGPAGGPIATNWSVEGWPTVYVIDPRGVIRFVDLRREDLLKGVRELLTETTRADTGASGG